MTTSETNPESGHVNPKAQHGDGTTFAPSYVAPSNGSIRLGEKPEKFNGKDFNKWQQNMLFYLTILNLARLLQENAQELDDMLIIGSNSESIKATKKMLVNKFDMKDLSVVDVVLDMKIIKTSNALVLSQSHYTEKVLDKI
ncbi:hypothetical protein RJ639_006657 [Escallonia herrerae]|uniref:Reverse transcriptase Ty1/copia-type domain-containing protein n=1 Tax=Escallonia herrerae TaxID=1293975 RepID=A0AA88W0N7_9ASTE|nr:hypothetical protein RJ639_006657 [Escallonia herrerae]